MFQIWGRICFIFMKMTIKHNFSPFCSSRENTSALPDAVCYWPIEGLITLSCDCADGQMSVDDVIQSSCSQTLTGSYMHTWIQRSSSAPDGSSYWAQRLCVFHFINRFWVLEVISCVFDPFTWRVCVWTLIHNMTKEVQFSHVCPSSRVLFVIRSNSFIIKCSCLC